MPALNAPHPPVYHHFVLLVWQERDLDGRHSAWRFSLLDSKKEVRIGFKDFDEMAAYLHGWLKEQIEESSK